MPTVVTVATLRLYHPVMPSHRVAVVQDAPAPFDRARTIAKVADLAADAARGGARLVVFPEAFVSAYPKGLDFGTRIGFGAEIVIEARHAVHFGSAEVQRQRDRRLGLAVYAAERRLHVVEDRQQGPFAIAMRRDDLGQALRRGHSRNRAACQAT